MYEWKVEHMNRRGLLLMAAAAGATLAMPRSVLSAAGKAGDRAFGGDLTTIRAVSRSSVPKPSSAYRIGSPCRPLLPRTAT